MDVKLTDDNMKDIIAKAVLDTLTPESRSALITNAIKGLLTTPTGTGYDKKSPLQEAFNWAVREVAQEVAREQIKGDPEIRATINKLITDSWTKLVDDENYSKLVEKVSNAIERGLTGDRY